MNCIFSLVCSWKTVRLLGLIWYAFNLTSLALSYTLNIVLQDVLIWTSRSIKMSFCWEWSTAPCSRNVSGLLGVYPKKFWQPSGRHVMKYRLYLVKRQKLIILFCLVYEVLYFVRLILSCCCTCLLGMGSVHTCFS